MDLMTLLPDLLLWLLAFVLSTTVHEAGHAWVARLGGDLTAYHAGQVSLSPLPHMRREPFGMVIVPVLSFFLNGGSWMFGWASAPYDPHWAERYPRRSALMALAGPMANLILLVVFLLLAHLLAAWTGIATTEGHSFWSELFKFAWIGFQLNLILMVFNLLPFPPLDGSEIILLFFPPQQAGRVRHTIQQMGLFGLLIAWLVFPMIYGPIRMFFQQFWP